MTIQNRSAIGQTASAVAGVGQLEATVSAGRVSEVRPSLATSDLKLHRIGKSYRKQRRGAAAVEFAIVAPLFVMLIFGMLEFGRMIMVQQLLTNASREGARKAVLDGATTSDVQKLVRDYLANSSVSGATVTVTPNPPTQAAFGEPVSVSVSIPFNQVSWLPGPMYLGGANMSATAVMRRESVP